MASFLDSLFSRPSAKGPSSVEVAAAYSRSMLAEAQRDPDEEEEYRLIAEIRDRKTLLESEQERLRALFRRLDNLYYPETITEPGGADHWPLEKKVDGRVHISVNNIPTYVDVPASLESVTPVENYVSPSADKEEREQIARAERLYFQWKDEDEFELKVHKGCVTKELYGFTFGRVMWDTRLKRPVSTVLEAPENLYVGWGNSDYSRIDWAIYCYGLSPLAVNEDYGLSVEATSYGSGKNQKFYPLVRTGDHTDPLGTLYSNPTRIGRAHSEYEDMQVEVYDYWYKKAIPTKRGKPPKIEIWNAIFVGNAMVKNARHVEYEDIPYIPLPNTFIPRSPYGRPALYDLEQLFREKDERLTNAGQMIQSVVGGQMWQLTGPDAPDEIPAGAIPRPNEMVAPGPGNEIRAIQPFVPQFAIEDYLKRIDDELEAASGLNGPLLGRASNEVLGSSKALNALVGLYEARIRMRRDLLYQWRKRMWTMAAKVWEAKDSDIKTIIAGNYRLDIKPPELTKRDELENAQRALNLVQNRIWTMERAMDATGVEDPTDEKSVIREEQTDPALNPAAVSAQATLFSTLKALGVQPSGAATDQAEATQEQALNTQRQLVRPVAGSQTLNGPENAANPPPESLPANAQPGGVQAQSMVQGGEATGRILTKTPIA